ncbi:hypothetical protein [Nocardioides terrisoli]|uniref:hypothetical protein n=1 Tax=Nocardioides terrisoli TaxID=3388267 RepID=UPI00287B9654|nr:hypothetical protein [Nocardioides marmorisolisilvae]
MAETYVTYNGYQYDARILGAPLEIIRLRERLNEAKSINASTLALGLAVESLERILADRLKGTHVLARRADEDLVCVCGLVVSAGTDVASAPGHLNQETWLPADSSAGSTSSAASWSSTSTAESE